MMKFKDFYLMSEMLVVGPKPKDRDYVIAFDKWIWIINDEMSDKDEAQNSFKKYRIWKL